MLTVYLLFFIHSGGHLNITEAFSSLEEHLKLLQPSGEDNITPPTVPWLDGLLDADSTGMCCEVCMNDIIYDTYFENCVYQVCVCFSTNYIVHIQVPVVRLKFPPLTTILTTLQVVPNNWSRFQRHTSRLPTWWTKNVHICWEKRIALCPKLLFRTKYSIV